MEDEAGSLNGLLEKRIGGFFAPHGGGRAVARVNNGFWRKGQNFFMNAGEQQLAIAPRQVPAADPIGEKNVSAEKLVGLRKIKAKASRTMARDQQKPAVGPSFGDWAGLLQKFGGLHWAKLFGETEGKHGVGL